MKYLLITSDDFGMTLSVNRGIAHALIDGLVQATNLMVPCPWFSDAVVRVKEHGLPTGIHLTLTCEWDLYRWRSLTDCPSLRAGDGCLHSAYASISPEITEEEIFTEYAAQLTELRRRGIEPTHADTHMLSAASAAPMELRVKAVVERFCKEEDLLFTYSTTESGALRYFESETMFSSLSVDGLKSILEHLGDGIHHVICHCAKPGDDLAAMCSTGHAARPWADTYRNEDYAAMMSPELREFVDREKFELVNMKRVIELLKSR